MTKPSLQFNLPPWVAVFHLKHCVMVFTHADNITATLQRLEDQL